MSFDKVGICTVLLGWLCTSACHQQHCQTQMSHSHQSAHSIYGMWFSSCDLGPTDQSFSLQLEGKDNIKYTVWNSILENLASTASSILSLASKFHKEGKHLQTNCKQCYLQQWLTSEGLHFFIWRCSVRILDVYGRSSICCHDLGRAKKNLSFHFWNLHSKTKWKTVPLGCHPGRWPPVLPHVCSPVAACAG